MTMSPCYGGLNFSVSELKTFVKFLVMSRLIRWSGLLKGKYTYKFICLSICEEERKKTNKINLEEKMNNII